MTPLASRLDSRLEQEGAEFLVLGHLLLEKIAAYKAYTRYPGYDIVTINPETGRQCRIQVKSRWATDYNRTFSIKNFECDFVVFVALNRGNRYGRPRRRKVAPPVLDTKDGREPPRFWVFPVDVVKAAQRLESKWGIVPLKNIRGSLDEYENNWELISAFLGEGART